MRTLTQIDRVPSLPSLYIEIVESLLQAEASLEDVTTIAVKDPGITATTLKLVNSPFFGTTRDISDAAKAISILGLETFRALVFNVNAFTQFESTRFRELQIDDSWQHGLAVAVAAKRIAQAEEADEKTCQEAYTAGFLHEIGGLVMACHCPEKYSDAITLAKERRIELGAAESQVLGVSHPAAGAYLLGLWGLPPAVVEAVAWHHSPSRATPRTFSPVTAVHVANSLVSDRKEFRREIPVPEIDLPYLAQLGLADRLPAWRQIVSEAASNEA